jgi:hypothetical protein
VAIDHLLWLLLEWLQPRSAVDIAPPFTWDKAKEQRDRIKNKSRAFV